MSLIVVLRKPEASVPLVVLAATMMYSDGWSVVPLPGPALPADMETKTPAFQALSSA